MKFFLIYTVLILGTFPLYTFSAQNLQQSPSVEISISGPVDAKSGEILSLTLKITNPLPSPFKGKIKIKVPDGIILLNKDTISVEVPESGQRFYPVKIKLEKRLHSGQNNFQVQLLSQGNQIQSQATHAIEVAPYRLLTLQAIEPRILMQSTGDSVKSSILVRNLGNIRENFKLIISMPSFHDPNSRKFEEIKMSLDASKDSTIAISFVVLKQMMERDEFIIQINGLLPNQDVFGTTQVIVQNTSSKRVFRNLDYGSLAQTPNQISAVARNLLTSYPYFSLYGNGTINHQETALDFNFNLNQSSSGGSPLAYNTWLRYDRNNKGFTLGNLNENSEKYLFGRGAKVHFGDSAITHVTEIGIMDKSYSLFDPILDHNPQKGFSAFVSTTHGMNPDQNLKYYSTLLFDQDPYELSESWLYFNSIETMRKRSGILKSFRIMLGGGLNRFWADGAQRGINTPNPTQNISSEYKPSLAGGLAFYGDWKGFQFNSSGYLSGGYYPGNKRGASQINQRISKNFKKLNTWLEYYYNAYEPKYNNLNPYLQTYFMSERSEIGFLTPLSPLVSISFGPRYEREEGVYFLATNLVPNPYEHENARLFTNISWRSRNYKILGNFAIEGGKQTKSSYQSSYPWNSRTQFNISAYNFQLSSSYQSGVYNLTDFVYNTQLEKKPSRLSATLNWSQYLIEKRFQLHLNASYYKDKNFGENRSTNARLQWNIRNTQLFTQGQLYSFRYDNRSSKPFYDLQFGITQNFKSPAHGNRSKSGNLKIKVFHDLNKNGIFDAGDELANAKSVLIGNSLFLTDAQGMIEYKKVPYRTYKIQAPVENSWYAPDRHVDIQSSKTEIEIPLSKSSILRGQIQFDFDPLKSLDAEITLEGYSITARSKSGQIYRTKTDQEGRYMLFLPEGEYSIYLLENEMPANVYSDVKNHYVICETEKINEAPTFILKVKEKEVEIKRFGK